MKDREAAIETLALSVFENRKAARLWLDRANVALAGSSPRRMCQSASGYCSVLRILHAIEYGLPA